MRIFCVLFFALCFSVPVFGQVPDVGPVVVVSGPDGVVTKPLPVDAASISVLIDAAPNASLPAVDAGVSLVDAAPATISTPPKSIQTPEDATAAVDFMVEAGRLGAWPLFSGMLILFLIWFADKVFQVKKRVPKRVVPWIAAGLGILGSVGVMLITGLPVASAIIQGFLSGATSVGLWEMLFKNRPPV